MKKCISAFVLLVLLLLQTTLAIIPSITVASAAGNVTINDFTCENLKGTVPFTTRLNGNVTGEVTKWEWDFIIHKLNIGLTVLETCNYWSYVWKSGSLWSF